MLYAVFSATNLSGIMADVLSSEPLSNFVCVDNTDTATAVDGRTFDKVYVDSSGETLYQSVTVTGTKVSV